MDGTGDHHVRQISQTQKDKFPIFSHMWDLKEKDMKIEMIVGDFREYRQDQWGD
jgi:hypothetical protein